MTEKAENKELEELFFQSVYPYYERLFLKAYSLIKNKEDAKDIVQETLLSAYKAFSKFKGKSNLYTWLYRILVNKCIDFLRKSKKEDMFLQRLQHPYSENSTSLFIESFEKNIEQNQIQKSLIIIIEKLEDKYKELIIMKYFDGLTYEEIAEIKNIKIGTVKSRLSKAKEKIVSLLQNEKSIKDFINIFS